MALRISGEKLRQAREAAGLSREDVALAIQRSPRTVQAYELGDKRPDLEVAARLCDLYREPDIRRFCVDDSIPAECSL